MNKDYKLKCDITDTISDKLLEPGIRNELCRLSDKYGIDIYCEEFTGRGYPGWLDAMTKDRDIVSQANKELWEYIHSQGIDYLVDTVSDIHEEFATRIHPKVLKFKYVKDSVMFSAGRIWIPEEV